MDTLTAPTMDERMLIPIMEEEDEQLPTFDELYTKIDKWHGPKRAYLQQLREGGSSRQACREAGVAYRTAYRWKNDDPAFKDAFEAAKRESAEILVERARMLSVEGIKRRRPIFYEGVEVGAEEWTEYDSQTLRFLIQAEAGDGLPTKYKPTKKLEVSGSITHLHELAEGARKDQREFDQQLLAEGELQGEVCEV